ncbi:hypothetical protein Tco_0804075 [Tanacetum coccineum]|uniref:Uncharacterized protein n=1 Tax=Tanacetum coccineum TaxID=301880 RepID=A0ABQ5A7F8_9ASTR
MKFMYVAKARNIMMASILATSASCFVLGNNSMFIFLVPEHPFGAYGYFSIREWNKSPNFVSMELVQFFLHCINPSWML